MPQDGATPTEIGEDGSEDVTDATPPAPPEQPLYPFAGLTIAGLRELRQSQGRDPNPSLNRTQNKFGVKIIFAD